MPKLLQINVTANRGSTGRIAEQIGEKALAAGWESFIAYGRDCGASKSKLIKIGSRLGVLWHALMTRITDKHGLYSKLATKRLVRRIEEIKPDIIHLHNIHGYYVNYKILFDYLRKANIPVVWTSHDCWTVTGHCSYFTFVKCEQWKTHCSNCPQKGAYPTSWVVDRSKKNHIDKKKYFSAVEKLTIVPVANWLGGVIKNSFLKDRRIEVIHNGIDITTFKPCEYENLTTRYNLAAKSVVLGVASPWSTRKGFPDFMRLYDMLDSARYQIVLIGLNKEQIEQLPNGIIAFERTNSVEELAKWYSLADVFVNPTYEDTYPTTNLEAIACGTPVITYRTGGSPESIIPQTGRVVEPGDLEGVVSAIEELCAEDREAMRKRCREYAVNNFDKEQNYEEYLKLYENILNNYK